jgi:hypothetical protein
VWQLFTHPSIIESMDEDTLIAMLEKICKLRIDFRDRDKEFYQRQDQDLKDTEDIYKSKTLPQESPQMAQAQDLFLVDKSLSNE